MIEALGHKFQLHGHTEMICHRCDFVIWHCMTPAEAACAVEMIGGGVCPAASGMEAPSGGETGNTGSTEGDSPTAESGDAQTQSSTPDNKDKPNA